MGRDRYYSFIRDKRHFISFGLANEFNKNLVILRKEQKLYHPMETYKEPVKTITTGTEQFLYLDAAKKDKLQNKNVLIVDDVISSGTSLKAMESLISAVEGNIVGRVFVLAEGDAYKRSDILYAERIQL